MSLEKQIQELTSAIKVLNESLQTINVADKKEPTQKKVEAKTAPKTTNKDDTKVEKKETEVKEKAENVSNGVTYEMVRDKTYELNDAKGREAVLTVFKAFGVKKSAKELKEDQFKDYVDAVVAALAA